MRTQTETQGEKEVSVVTSLAHSCYGVGDEVELEVQVPDDNWAGDFKELKDCVFGECGIGFCCYEKDGKRRTPMLPIQLVALPGLLIRNIGRTCEGHVVVLLKETKKECKSSYHSESSSVDNGIRGVKGDDDSRQACQGEDGNNENAGLHKRFSFNGEL